MSRSCQIVVRLVLFLIVCGGRAHATGDFSTPTMFANGARQATGTPEFFWELECKRIAREFVPPEKRLVPPGLDARPASADEEETEPSNPREEFTTKTDLTDFQAALTGGSLKPVDQPAATAAHAAAREVINKASLTRNDGLLPEETPGEFADYHKGALAYKTHRYDQARAAWEALLARPADERKYRSTWAAYMLGRCALDERQYEKAIACFQQTRKLAKDGFVDSLGLAAESYGWEGRCELECDHAEASARLYLTQLALGDVSAVVSLKWFVPDWGVAVNGEGAEEAQPGADSAPDSPGLSLIPRTKPPRGAKAFDTAARNPLLRRLVSSHILAVCSWQAGYDNSLSPEEQSQDQQKWLTALDQAGVKETPDAEYIGWIAYSAGQYADAKRWLAKSSGTSAAALWLKAKFCLRDGKMADGTKLLSQALNALPSPQDRLENSSDAGRYSLPADTANGELGLLHLAQSDFVQALDAFLTAGFWGDAAYVAERCLTKDELLDYTRNRKFAAVAPKTQSDADEQAFCERRFRHLVARRMVREDDYQTAKEFFTPEMVKVLDEYTAALTQGADKALSKKERARALFHAAWMARYQGMELMGTEVGPDNTLTEGAFNEGDLAIARLTGKEPVIEDGPDGATANSPDRLIRFALPVSKQEKERLEATKLTVERRFHYRHVAAGLAWKAAALLPDNSPETADVLNTAGNWLKDRHEKQAERFFVAIKSRCANTPLGKLAVAKHWFIDDDGPWSSEEREAMPQNQQE